MKGRQAILPRNFCMLGRGRHWSHLVSELGGFGLEVLDLALAVLKLVEGRSLVHVFYPVAEHAVESPMFGLIHFSRQPFHNSNVAGAIGLRLRRWMWSSHHFVCPEKDRFLETADGVTRSGTYQRMVFHAQKNSESGPARPACGIIFSTDASVVAAMNRN